MGMQNPRPHFRPTESHCAFELESQGIYGHVIQEDLSWSIVSNVGCPLESLGELKTKPTHNAWAPISGPSQA